jgi:knotted carbamoyltransferase YgeW
VKNLALEEKLQEWAGLKSDLRNRDFLLTWEHSLAEIRSILLAAQCLRTLYDAGRSLRVFDTGLAVSIFRDQSTRTRFSFASAAAALGLNPSDLDEAKSQMAHGETVRETAVMISFLAEAIGIRDDIYLGEGNRNMREFAAALQEGYEKGVLSRRPAVINLQCDIDHPTQTLADLLHLEQRFGDLDALHGKKFVISWAYSPSYGKPLSVPQGLIALLSRFGMDLTLAYPEGYDLMPELIELAENQSACSGGAFRVSHDMIEAFSGAEIVYPKSWAPMRVVRRRTELLRKADQAELLDLEKECLEENARHKSWQYDEAMMKRTASGSALYMHCLPADISGVSCEQGEVSRDVFERFRLETYRQASWKPFVIAALIFLTRVPEPLAALRRLAEASSLRIR